MADDVLILAEGLGKKFMIGHVAARERYIALRDELVRGAHSIWRKTLDMVYGRPVIVGDSIEEFWALKDVSFQVKRGEVLGIIGHNGAGKSTLLKILSRITEPTEGRVMINGRVASLLEVGTGFHPELSGRENIYLNGTILGMTRAEIRHKFDEIVAFAEIEKFLDTPAKRYSSGMYVRLAFAVAAHLDPEILIVDEVLAVGDAGFQKKSLEKMSKVASGGRTVLFVSHNMTAIENLCRSCIALQNGRIFSSGPTTDVLTEYLGTRETVKGEFDLSLLTGRDGAGPLRFARMRLVSENDLIVYRPRVGETLSFYLRFSGSDATPKTARVSVAFCTNRGTTLFICDTRSARKDDIRIADGDVLKLTIPELPLSAGTYRLRFYLERGDTIEDWITDGVEIEVADGDFFGSGQNTPPSWHGQVTLVRHSWDCP
jgi:lipopolysaccharide transport system ATP-binding protein